ncbi:MAG: DEAD/DEAH box helicase [Candidatus Omnitrophota bacterium]
MKRKKKGSKKPPIKISHMWKPEGMSLEGWQKELRALMAGKEKFRMKNKGGHPVFSTFEVRNPKTGKTYKVVIRGEEPGINYCSCPDFSINTLGTCKHIESVLRKLRRVKGAKRILREGYVSEHSSVTLRYGTERKIVFVTGRGASARLKETAAEFFDKNGMLTGKGFKQFDKFMMKVRSLNDDVRYHDDAIEFIALKRDMTERGKRVRRVFSGGIKDPAFQDLLKTDLYPYQREGALFAVAAGRSLIADDMGLGKTVQAIAAGEIMAKCFGIEKVLIVCPTSLKYQWLREIERFSGRSVHVIQGMLHKRRKMYEEDRFFKITNYDVIHRDIEVIGDWAPDLIILDEAQRIKNWKTRLARSVKQLSSTYAIVLTGTPLENRLEELHSIMEFLDRHHLGPLFRFLHTHQKVNETGRVTGYTKLNDIGKSLEPVLIRRRKEDVLTQLPERADKNYFVPMTAEQAEIHTENAQIVMRIVNKWKRYGFLTDDEKQRLMCALQNMRMVSDNTYLIDNETVRGDKVDELEEQLKEIFETKGTKVVIFSEWLKMIELVTAMLDENKWKYGYLHGAVPAPKRGELVRAFNEDPDCRVFMSTQAGGVGLNLQSAEVVINMDLPWNPAVLEQRISRVHRMGQKRPVRVINFVTEGSIEHGMLSLLAFKRAMFEGVLDGGQDEIFMGETRFSRFMKTVEAVTDAMDAGRGDPSDQLIQEEIKETLQDARSSREEITEDAPDEGGSAGTGSGIAIDSRMVGNFLTAGARLLENLNKQFGASGDEMFLPASGSFPGVKAGHDRETGKKTINIPMPDEDTMKKIARIGNMINELFKK